MDTSWKKLYMQSSVVNFLCNISVYYTMRCATTTAATRNADYVLQCPSTIAAIRYYTRSLNLYNLIPDHPLIDILKCSLFDSEFLFG